MDAVAGIRVRPDAATSGSFTGANPGEPANHMHDEGIQAVTWNPDAGCLALETRLLLACVTSNPWEDWRAVYRTARIGCR
jgi:hypothetical protein